LKSIGGYIAKRINIIKEWRNVANGVAQIIKQITPRVEVYVFGSTVAGRVTGSSDIDILVVVPDNLSEREINTHLSVELEERLGSLSHIPDLHIARRENIDKPPYKRWFKNSGRSINRRDSLATTINKLPTALTQYQFEHLAHHM